MKKTNLFILAIVNLLFLGSCSKFLETRPQDTPLEEDALNNYQDFKLVLNGAYDQLRSGSLFGGNAWMLTDLMADELDGSQLSGDWLGYYNRSTNLFNGSSRGTWGDAYRAIYRGNLLLDRMDRAVDATPVQKAIMEGEIKFIRAICHFHIVRLFAQPFGFTPDNSHLGIPIRTNSSFELVNRAPVSMVYDQILRDLKDAAATLPDDNQGYATKWAAMGYLAKVYFQMNNFDSALNYANLVINSGRFQLENDLKKRIAMGGNSENVFELISTGLENVSGGALYGIYRSDDPGQLANRSITLNQDLFVTATLDPADLRANAWFREANGRYFTKKFDGENAVKNIPLLHLTDLKLIRAESAVKRGNTALARTDISDITNRAGLGPITAADPNRLLEIIRNNRRIEMSIEGDRLHELKRIAVLENPNLLIRGAIWNCPGMVVQIPDDETKGNPFIVQNPQGGCN